MEPARRITFTLFIAQALSSTAFLASGTVSSIVGAELSGRASLAGVPGAIYLLGTAAGSFILGRASDRTGRRRALAAAFAAGAAGAAVAVWAISVRTFTGFAAGLLLLGPASAAAIFSRFVAAEVHEPAQRGRAIANVVVGGTVGTFIWPFLSTTFGPALVRRGISDTIWPYLVTLFMLVGSAMLVAVFLKPEPRDLARALAGGAGLEQAAGQRTGQPSIGNAFLRPGTIVAVGSMICANAIMMMVMVITSLHMAHLHHGVPAIAWTISVHVFGMYAFSILSGRLADKVGRAPVIVLGASTLGAACLVAPLSPAFAPITAGLFLLGLGWNLCFVGGSALLSDQLLPEERARTQGVNDLLMGLVSAAGSFLSGHVFAAVGYGTMGAISAGVALVPLVLATWWHLQRGRQLRPV